MVHAGTLVFDYPSVRAAAKHVHTLLAARSSCAIPQAGPLPLAAPAQHLSEELVISMDLVARLPSADAACDADAVHCIPYGRWDVEAHRHGKVLALPLRSPALLASCMHMGPMPSCNLNPQVQHHPPHQACRACMVRCIWRSRQPCT